MTIHNFDRWEVTDIGGTDTYYTTTITPTIDENTDIVAYFTETVQTGNPIIPIGSRIVIGALWTLGERPSR